jgi:hypothetical protein
MMHDWETDPRPIAELLPAWEASHGWSSAEAARQVGAPYLTYRRWRDGNRKPSPELMLRRLMTLIDRAAA